MRIYTLKRLYLKARTVSNGAYLFYISHRMIREELKAFDDQFVHETAPSLNFVTNMVGSLIIAEAVKLITGMGKVILYPQYVEFDIFNFKMKIRHSNMDVPSSFLDSWVVK